ncbi:MAG: MarC family protein [Chloroflexi bacterium]|nr:MarC family protein [Chloroflexota bacterium]
MTDYLKLALIFFAAVNPASVALAMGRPAGERRTMAAAGFMVAAAVLAAAAGVADSLLDLLEIAPETFRIAGGIVMVTAGVLALWEPGRQARDVAPGWQGGLFPLGIPLLAGPAAVAAVMSYGADEGTGLALGALAPAVVLATALFVAAAERPSTRNALRAVAMLTAALLVVAGAGLIVSGVRDI